MGLLDFAQSASNAAASTVTGPVDLLALALRKLGIPVGDAPIGGTDWAKQHGLLRDVQHGPSQVLGETVGLLSPAAVPAKSAQIARGLLQMGENAAAPALLNSQKGAIVFHGSPHKFDRFDSSKIGTGEGAQAYGHGLYLADGQNVASYYRSAGIDPSSFVPLRSIRDPAQMASTALERAGGDVQHATAVLTRNAQSGDITAGAALQLLNQRAGLPESKYAGNLYKVDLPDSAIARMLNWDKPLSQQPAVVREVMSRRADVLKAAGARLSDMPDGQSLYRMAHPQGGIDSVDWSKGPAGQASDFLRAHGIPGIRYLDGGSRGAGAGTSNYVVFPGEESILTILERNGIPLR